MQYYCPVCDSSLYLQYDFDEDADSCTCSDCGTTINLNRYKTAYSTYGVTPSADECVDNYHLSYASSDDDTGGGWGNIAAILSASALTAAALRDAKQSEIAYQKSQNRWERRKSAIHWACKHIILLMIMLAIIVFASIGAKVYWDIKTTTPIGYTNDELLGLDWDDVESSLQANGFTNIKYNIVDNLSLDEIERENIVTNIKIGTDVAFDSDSKYPYNTKIILTYHVLQKFSIVRSSDEIVGENYESIVDELEKSGFSNIQLISQDDLIFGVFNKDGEISEITVDGDDEFYANQMYRPDVQITITYHNFK